VQRLKADEFETQTEKLPAHELCTFTILAEKGCCDHSLYRLRSTSLKHITRI